MSAQDKTEELKKAGPDLDLEIQEGLFGNPGRIEPRPFSTDITAAMDVLETLHKAAWFWRIDSVLNGYICTVQRIVGDLKQPNPERVTFQIGAPTLPLAICLAASKTYGKTEKNS